MRVLTLYQNCSYGGMTTVYMNRAKEFPDNQYDFIFCNDYGARGLYQGLPNVNVKIIGSKSIISYLTYYLTKASYDLICVCLMPDLLTTLRSFSPKSLIAYEIHNPSALNVGKDLQKIDYNVIDEIWCPSQWQKHLIESNLPPEKYVPIKVKPNILNVTPQSPASDGKFKFTRHKNKIPLLWVGRAWDMHKNCHDFFRILAMLPETYYGILVLSLQKTSENTALLLGLAAAYGVEDRIELFMNLDHENMRDLYVSVKKHGGIFCSTSLAESFGYGVQEADGMGLPVVAYDIGPLKQYNKGNMYFVAVGDTRECGQKVLALTAKK